MCAIFCNEINHIKNRCTFFEDFCQIVLAWFVAYRYKITQAMTPTDGDIEMTFNFANHIGYSDTNPFEIVRRVSDRTIEIRAMDAERANPDADMGFKAGGFVGHFSDQHKQEWTITSNPNARVIRIRLHKDGRWRCNSGERYVLAVKPVKFYDYNF